MLTGRLFLGGLCRGSWGIGGKAVVGGSASGRDNAGTGEGLGIDMIRESWLFPEAGQINNQADGRCTSGGRPDAVYIIVPSIPVSFYVENSAPTC